MDKGKVIVSQFVTLDGVVEDPDGSGGTPGGGWAFRFGPKRVADDDFELGSILDTGVLLMGRTTWEVFSRRWPNRSDEFAGAMNRSSEGRRVTVRAVTRRLEQLVAARERARGRGGRPHPRA